MAFLCSPRPLLIVLFWVHPKAEAETKLDAGSLFLKREGKREWDLEERKIYVSVHYWECHSKYQELNSLGISEKHEECFPELSIWRMEAGFHYSLPSFPHWLRVVPRRINSPKCSSRGFHCDDEVPKAKSRKMEARSLRRIPAKAMWVWAHVETSA